MVQRYDILKRDMVKSDDGNMVLYPDYADLEQRFDALSSKFAALVEENATLRKRLDESCRFTVDPDSEFAKDSMELKEGE